MTDVLKKSFLFVLFVSCVYRTIPESVVVDLGGVLVHTDHLTVLREIGIQKFVLYLATGVNPLKLNQTVKNRFYGFLENIFPHQSNHGSCDEQGTRLPTLMYCWLKGTLTSAQVRNIIATELNAHDMYFKSTAEKNIILAIAQLTFTPEKLIATRALNMAALQFICSCKQAGHSVYILSNWDPDSFSLLKKRFPELFDLCDGEIISGGMHSTKPENTIYQTLLDTYNLDPAQTIFLDDRPENLQTAHSFGIATIHCNTHKVKNFHPVYDEINAWLRSNH